MNVLFLTPKDSGKNLGGVEGHVRILTEELEKRGHKVEELSLDEIDVLNKNRLPRAAGGGSRNDEYLFKGLALGYKFKAWGYLWEKRDLFRWADVIHVHDVFWWVIPLLPVIWWGKLDCHVPLKAGLAMTKTKVFVTFHGWEEVCPPSRSAVWQKRMAAFLSNGTIGVGSFFEKWYGVKTDRVVWGCAEKIKKPEKKKDGEKRGKRIQIVFLGRLEKVNGMEVVVEALEKIKKKEKKKDGEKRGKREFEFIFVGDGSYRKQAEKFGKVTGMVKNPQKYLVYADVVITSSYMSMLEAAAMGKPVIAVVNNELKMDYLNCHPLKEWIRVVGNAEELIDEIKKLKINKDWEKRGKRWAVGQTAERLADVYEGLWRRKR